jgi:hypothetical protein
MENNKIIEDGSLPEVEKSTIEVVNNKNEGIIQIINSLRQKLHSKEKLWRVLRNFLIIIISILVTFSLIIFIIYLVPVLEEVVSVKRTKIVNNQELRQDPAYKKQISLMSRDIQRLTRKYNSYTSGQSYIVINTTDNRFLLYRNKKLIREGSCSTGSYKKLLTAEGKSWTFKTPRGKFSIQSKRTNPAWHKPDWAFIEEGIPIPPKDSPLRWEAGVLGDYAMDLGDSYMIHGTIYKRFLGMPVTHGCVRLNDEDLEAIFNTLSIGSKVYIF